MQNDDRFNDALRSLDRLEQQAREPYAARQADSQATESEETSPHGSLASALGRAQSTWLRIKS